ncbi:MULTISPECIES: metal ABC transporter permease [unclassified Lentimonas]|uniref:metal ABC transporter permease n=1 Tax=unclassified Lentimonas TaxID=2630993 RepID=UPI0013294981|nr:MULTISPECIES: metal ABC transporter permease [unclassified Lentimonas]CAA6678663.1 Manganese ABC transporter, inner membrane permease protein SitD [Lentimonas sp. CC4]CAA6683649.1 Manganese ABC transporter, inner membrane permease protein SitD [Lentimonas sp. CC6]CAA7074505.1 Manganese ABC transporter, inner membrane permease protein SitD [Lentimonas sp. CC4]CAA7169117.1 Manganese ABC transporter, inner membrane permease protein SitD [Lentimonas sp. CC21]CAA7180478.1 Manganese ABC transport
MTWVSIDTWIVIVGILAAVSCALLGNFLVLRKMSMMGDAISHAVLPGLAIAFLITGARASLTMFIGAAVVGILTAVFTQWVSRFGKVDEGASMGIVFTTLFALGLLLIVQAADHVDLDASCVLYGAIEMTPLDVVWRPEVFGTVWQVPRAALVLLPVCVVNLLFVVLFFKELRITSFDSELATTMGINANVMHYMLMTLVAITTVAAFEAVGSIIVIAMLIVPAASAHLLTDRLDVMVIISVLLSVVAAVLGHVSAIVLPGWLGLDPDVVDATSTSGMMAVMAGVIFAVVLFCAPRHGILVKKFRRLETGS